MKWIRRILVLLVSLPVLAVAALLLAGQRQGAGRNTERLAIARPPSEVYRHLVDPELLGRDLGVLAGAEG